jgi:hypothetical protein
MSDAMTEPRLFSVSNHHGGDGNEPPFIDGNEPETYHSYFENAHGDQSLFIFRRKTREAVLYSGDAGWLAFPVIDGQVPGLVLSPDEVLWVAACLQAIA